MITPSASPKLSGDFVKRAAYAREHGVHVGTVGSQAAALASYIDNILEADAGADLGEGHLPAGEIRLDSTVELVSLRGYTIQGCGACRNNTGPRNHGGVTTGGTAIYWDGTLGGTVFELDSCGHLHLADFNVYLADSTTAVNAALVGFHVVRQQAGQGSGEHYFENITVSGLDFSPPAGSTAFKFGEEASPTGPQNDTCLFVNCYCDLVDIGFHFVNEQAVEFTHICPRFRSVNTWYKFDRGGVLHVFGAMSQDDQTGHETVICFVDHGVANSGVFNIVGLYCDRQADQYYTLYEMGESCVETQMYAAGVHLNPMNSGGGTMDGSKRAFIEARAGAQVTLDSCFCSDQSIVRWRNEFSTVNAKLNRDALVAFRGGYVAARQFGSELVTALEGGYAGRVRFKGVRAGGSNTTRMMDVWVNEFPIQGSSATHFDPDHFDDSNRDGVLWGTASPNGTWLSGGKTNSPSWQADLVAYYPMDEASGATSLIDRVNFVAAPANDLTIDGVMQVEGPPLPYMDRWCDWSLSVADTGRDTGIVVDPSAEESLTLFFLVQWTSFVDNSPLAALKPAGTSYEFLRCFGTSGNVMFRRFSGTEVFAENFSGALRSPCSIILVCDAVADTITLYVNGRLARVEAAPGYAAGAASNLWIGGSEAKKANAKLSRFGAIKAALSAKEATILAMQMAVTATRQAFFPTV